MTETERRCRARDLETAIIIMAGRVGDARMEWTLHDGPHFYGERLRRRYYRRERALVRLVGALSAMAGG